MRNQSTGVGAKPWRTPELPTPCRVPARPACKTGQPRGRLNRGSRRPRPRFGLRVSHVAEATPRKRGIAVRCMAHSPACLNPISFCPHFDRVPREHGARFGPTVEPNGAGSSGNRRKNCFRGAHSRRVLVVVVGSSAPWIAPMTAHALAPVLRTSARRSSVIPPIATSGRSISARRVRRRSQP